MNVSPHQAFNLVATFGSGGGFGGLPMLADGGGFELPGESGGGSEDPVERLRGLIDDRREEAVQVLRSWLDTPEEVE